MKSLIVEDDFLSRELLIEILEVYGPVQYAVKGKEAINLIEASLDNHTPFDLICLDICIPEMNGHEVLKQIRLMEEEKKIISPKGSKIIMTTILNDIKNVSKAYFELCNGYLTKPIKKNQLLDELNKLRLINT